MKFLLCEIDFPGHAFLAFATGLVNQELLLRNQYSVAENRVSFPFSTLKTRVVDQGAPGAPISGTSLETHDYFISKP
jgi:hypothetical protein